MHLEVVTVQGDGFVEVATVHGDERLIWNTSTYAKLRLGEPSKVFDGINGYWATLSPQAQAQIFNAYKEIKTFLDEVVDPYDIMHYLRKHVVLMYQQMDLDAMSRWLLLYGGLYIPSEIQDTIDNDSRYSEDQTYLKEDYINLATLALAVRPMLPVWGEFVKKGDKGEGSDLYKEIDAIGLIGDTQLMTWPEPKSAFEKLYNYIRITTEGMPVSMGSLWRGMGSAEIPVWLQARVLVRRLSVVPLTDQDSTHSIIANVYNYVRANVKPNDRRRSERVGPKIRDAEGRDEDDKTSHPEQYKIKQRITNGDAVLFAVYSENMAGIAQKVDPTVDLHLLEQTVEATKGLDAVQINPHQIRLAQWVLAKAYPPRAVNYIPAVAVYRLLATTQALLWHWGFLDLACLMLVERLNITGENIPGITRKPRTLTRITSRHRDALVALFPHAKPQAVRGGDVASALRNGNMAAMGINNLTKQILGNEWYYRGPYSLQKLAGQPEGRGLVVLNDNIKSNITELVLHLAELNK